MRHLKRRIYGGFFFWLVNEENNDKSMKLLSLTECKNEEQCVTAFEEGGKKLGKKIVRIKKEISG